ncbi:MAG TPA: acetolactate synthase small subunit [Candidatus Dormibacteraeota bacterium]|jgi:acetolactate synthase-1/3 small subunit|nr:acetolactate synthase small subunit [Candidatus Dormibacteraeota bacterium]
MISQSERIRVLSVLVEDGSSTLTKVAGTIRRRGFHVQAITVGPSGQAGRSRMTLQIDAGHAEVDQVRKQLERLVEVVEIEDLTEHDIHSRELVVARVPTSAIPELLDRGARVLQPGEILTTIEFAGDGEEVGIFVEELRRHGNLDVVRSGPVVMRRQA